MLGIRISEDLKNADILATSTAEVANTVRVLRTSAISFAFKPPLSGAILARPQSDSNLVRTFSIFE